MVNAIAIVDADRAGTRATNIDAAGRLQVKATVSPVIALDPRLPQMLSVEAFGSGPRSGTHRDTANDRAAKPASSFSRPSLTVKCRISQL
jgi:hypothetical protein